MIAKSILLYNIMRKYLNRLSCNYYEFLISIILDKIGQGEGSTNFILAYQAKTAGLFGPSVYLSTS